ncbi:MAG: rod shape-determining protein MreC [Proteobacteria bacterium]|jgi:rod shape-determining protein MreC|nr:rod shape-determining protein MreC [Pseudomonadota bacterium]
MSFLSRYKDVFISIAALVIPFFFLKANLKDPAQMTPFDRVVVTISTPLQWAATAVIETIGGTWEKYVYLVDLQEENARLEFENQRLRAENGMYFETEQEARRLRRMLTFKETFGGSLRAARVVGRGIAEQFRVIRIRIDVGDDEVAKGMPVVTFDGLVGQVNRFVGSYSDVMLSVDRKSYVPVVVQRNGAQGILRGTGELDRYTCEVEYLLRSDEVREGDQLFTSGAGGKFPEGILVGRIATVQRENYGLFQKVTVEPAVNFSRLSEVFVITALPGEEESAAAKGGASKRDGAKGERR